MDSNEAQCAYQQAQNPGRILGTAEGMGNACAEAPRSKTIRTQVEIPACHGFGTALEHLKRGGKVFIRIFPDKPISQKPAEVRMGNGKGNPEYYVAEIQPGKVLYEINGVPEQLAREAFTLAAAKLPLRTVFVERLLGA